jgi:hypothetical protein
MDSEARAAAWLFLSVFIAFKVVVIAVIVALQPSWSGASVLIALHGYWLLAPLIFLFLPTPIWVRLLRMRARRKQLIRSEWQVEPSGRPVPESHVAC